MLNFVLQIHVPCWPQAFLFSIIIFLITLPSTVIQSNLLQDEWIKRVKKRNNSRNLQLSSHNYLIVQL